MNYRHEFCEESTEALQNFVRACQSLKGYHEPKEKEIKKWKPFMNNLTPDEINQAILQLTVVTKSSINETEDIERLETIIPHSAINDISEEEDMQTFYVENLQNEPEERIQQLYRNALLIITFSDLIEIGESIKNINPKNVIVKCFCKELLFPMMSGKFSEDLIEFFQEFCGHYSSLVIKQLIDYLRVNDELEILFLYLNSKSSLEDHVLREFLITPEEHFPKKSISILDTLIHKGTDYKSMRMVIDLMSAHAVKYREDKDYGKLLLKVIECLGPQVQFVRNEIDRILSIHVSMWKIKLKKMYFKYSEKNDV